MYFPTAEIEVFPLVPAGAAFIVSFFASMGGFSGAFLLLPFQMSVLGYTNISVSPTNQLYNVFSNPAGFLRYYHEHRMLWPLAWIILAGTVPGLFAGVFVRVCWLPDVRQFKLFVALVLLGIGIQLLRDIFRPRIQAQTPDAETTSRPIVEVTEQNLSSVTYTYDGCLYRFSVPKLFAFCGIVGLVGGIYGIGGGAIISPFLVSVFHLPIYTIAGATLIATSLSSVLGVGFYMLIAPFFPQLSITPDWGIAALLGIGGLLGMYLGARCQKHVPASLLKGMMLMVLLSTAGLYLFQYFGL